LNLGAAVAMILAVMGLATAALSVPAFAVPPPRTPSPSKLSVVTRMEPDASRDNLPLLAEGSVTYQFGADPDTPAAATSVCFYAAYNDTNPESAYGSSRRFDFLAEKTGRQRLIGGQTEVIAVDAQLPAPTVENLAPHVLRVTTFGQEIRLQFKSRIPRPQSFSRVDFQIEGFYPVPLRSCPGSPFDSLYFQPEPSEISTSVQFPEQWQYIGPGTKTGNIAHARLRARTFGFFLASGMNSKIIRNDGPRVQLWYRSERAADLDESLAHALATQEVLFGPFPFPSLDLVESSDVEKPSLPGLISVNRPRQEVLGALQSEWLNWRQWLVTAFTANQWFGQSVSTPTPDDGWLLDGLSDYATLETLALSKIRYNLFNTHQRGFHIFSFNYLQIQELVASSLRRSAPTTHLTTDALNTSTPMRQGHPLSYIKHALALRQLKSQAGSQAVAGWLRQVARKYQYVDLSPQQFMASLRDVTSPFSQSQRIELAGYLKQWWVSEGWPDLSLVSLDRNELPDKKWAATVHIKQSGAIKVPTRVLIRDAKGNERKVSAEALDGDQSSLANLVATTVMKEQPDYAVVDPDHEVYDANRYDNRSGFIPLKFFPGNARTLADDEYTLIWAPYAYRHPGEPVSVGLQGALFKYLQGSTRVRIESYPKNGRGAGFVHHISDFPELKLNAQLLLQQNYAQDRMVQASLLRSPFISISPLLNVGAKLRYRENIDEPDSNHYTGAINSNLKLIEPWRRLRSARVSVEAEHAPTNSSGKFSYERQVSTAEMAIALSRRGRIDASFRGFYGRLTKSGEAPGVAYFRLTNLDEARLRIDQSTIPLVDQVTSLNSEVSFPVFLPFPGNSLVLSRDIRWRGFYDLGLVDDVDGSFRAAGLGLDVPFGGDIMGAGSLTFTRLSMLAVLYTSVAGEVSRKPAFLFDVTGEL